MNELNTWESRISAAAQALNTTPEALEAALLAMGIQKAMGLEMLGDDDVFKFGDFREAFKDHGIAALRMAMKFLKGGKKAEDRTEVDPRTVQLTALGYKVKLDDAPTDQLLRLYDPAKPSDPVTNALRKRFDDKPVIAFDNSGKVAVEATVEYVSGLEQGWPVQETIMVEGKLAKLWKVGEKPNLMAEEDPLFPGQPLRNGCSTVNARNWSKVDKRSRQLCRVILNRGEIEPNNPEAVLRLLERAELTSDALPKAYPEADLELRELEARSDAPKLMVPVGGTAAKPQNPFGVKRRY